MKKILFNCPHCDRPLKRYFTFYNYFLDERSRLGLKCITCADKGYRIEAWEDSYIEAMKHIRNKHTELKKQLEK